MRWQRPASKRRAVAVMILKTFKTLYVASIEKLEKVAGQAVAPQALRRLLRTDLQLHLLCRAGHCQSLPFRCELSLTVHLPRLAQNSKDSPSILGCGAHCTTCTFLGTFVKGCSYFHITVCFNVPKADNSSFIFSPGRSLLLNIVPKLK